MVHRRRTAVVVLATLLALAPLPACGASASSASVAPGALIRQLPADAPFDYQISADYPPPEGVSVVSRDWHDGSPLEATGAYSICYVNAFQTQPDTGGEDRPDTRSRWPEDLVLTDLGEDPEWSGEYLVDLSTAAERAEAAAWVAQMVDTCASKGFDAVELDNLDSWTRFDGTPLEGRVPFGQEEAVAFAALLTGHAHSRGLAVAQKNTPQLGAKTSLETIGFDLAVVEECGRYDECEDFAEVFGGAMVAIEYTDEGFEVACGSVGDDVAVVRRDRDVSEPGSDEYVFATC